MRQLSAPPRSYRNGWTAERQAQFIEALLVHRSVTLAAAVAGMSRESAYWLRRQPRAAIFRAQWHAALAFEMSDAAFDALLGDQPEDWTTRRLVRRLERRAARESRATRPKQGLL